MRDIRIAFTTDAAGAATANAESAVFGKLYAVLYLPGTAATGADLTLTCEGEASKALLTVTNGGTSNAFFYPRDLVHGVEDGVALTGTAGGDRAMPIMAGKPKLVVAQGGDTKSGTVILYYLD